MILNAGLYSQLRLSNSEIDSDVEISISLVKVTL